MSSSRGSVVVYGASLMWLCALGPACGGSEPDPERYLGAYEGTLTRTDEEGGRTFMYEETERFIYVAPSESGQLAVHLRDTCQVEARMEPGGELTIEDRCAVDSELEGLDVRVIGSGSVTEGGQLTLEYTLEGTIRRPSMEQTSYVSTNSFEGQRR